ncbi:unnamed protein product [Arabis nemorensis]|uniref:Uncharacterized protein n=1 Tax=Arabis nemorensis TaxID=586526 RepID=A0A565BUN2_9BRAS|nr:unnamed protein product [Arabis nemorensis]
MDSELKFPLDLGRSKPRRFSAEDIELLEQMHARVVQMHSSFREWKEELKSQLKAQLEEPKTLENVESLEHIPVLQVHGALDREEDRSKTEEQKLILPLGNIVEHLGCEPSLNQQTLPTMKPSAEPETIKLDPSLGQQYLEGKGLC